MRLLRPVVDAASRVFAEGSTWHIEAIDADVATMKVTLQLRSLDGEATLCLDLRAPDGPRLGRMRDWFDVIDPPADAPREAPRAAPRAWALSALADALRSDDPAAAESRLRALARDYDGERLQLFAERLEAIARELAAIDHARAAWLYERAIDAWYGWGAMATSGGDGAARVPRIEAARARHAAFLAGIRA